MYIIYLRLTDNSFKEITYQTGKLKRIIHVCHAYIICNQVLELISLQLSVRFDCVE